MTVAVEDEKLSLAIGRNGQNARLASKLTGWKVNIMSETDYNESKKREAEMLVPVGDLEGIGTKIRDKLISSDISSIQRLAQTPVESLVKIEGIGQKTAETLVERAKEYVVKAEAARVHKDKTEPKTQSKQDEDKKLEIHDVFVEDPDYVTEVDDIPEAQAPDLDALEEDETDDKESK
jgi:transcription termination/antitermination protein NusA